MFDDTICFTICLCISPDSSYAFTVCLCYDMFHDGMFHVMFVH